MAGRPRTAVITDPLAVAVREWRDARGLNVEQTGEALGLAAKTIEHIEQGRGFAHPRLLMLAMKNFKKSDFPA